MPRKPPGCRDCWACRARSLSSTTRSPIVSRRENSTCRCPGSPIISGRPRWTSSRSTSRTTRRTGGSGDVTTLSSSHAVIPGWCPGTRPGISRFQVRCFASPRNDEPSPPHPFRRAFFGKRLRPLDVILRRHHRLHGRIVALLGDRLFKRDRKAFLYRLLGGADRHRAVLADGFRPALRGRQRFTRRHHLIDKTELVAFARGA